MTKGDRLMRLSRPCYDKPHRCPGWAGGGWRSAKADRCDGGTIRVRVPMEGCRDEWEYPGTRPWRFGFCNECDVRTWPRVTRHIDPTYWRHGFWLTFRRLDDWLYWKGWRS